MKRKLSPKRTLRAEVTELKKRIKKLEEQVAKARFEVARLSGGGI